MSSLSKASQKDLSILLLQKCQKHIIYFFSLSKFRSFSQGAHEHILMSVLRTALQHILSLADFSFQVKDTLNYYAQ